MPLPPSGRLAYFTGNVPGLQYAANATTRGILELPQGTAGITIVSNAAFSSITVMGETTKLTYLSLSNTPGKGQQGSVSVSSEIDPRLVLTVTSGAGQSGAVQVVAFPSALPQTALAAPLGRAILFPSLSRAPGTYVATLPNTNGAKGLIAYLAVTGGTGTVTMTIQNSAGQTMAGGGTDSLLATTAIAVGAGGNLYLYPGGKAVANLSDNFPLGQTPLIQIVVATAATTCEVDYDLLP